MQYMFHRTITNLTQKSQIKDAFKGFQSLSKALFHKKGCLTKDVTNRLKANFNPYIREIEEITGRSMPVEQVGKIQSYLKGKEIVKLNEEDLKIHRKDFLNKKQRLISDWEQMTGQKWPKYKQNIYNQGKVVRKRGQNYDVHHIIECQFGGPNQWWNAHPASFPNEHQNGIHRAGSFAHIIFRTNEKDTNDIF